MDSIGSTIIFIFIILSVVLYIWSIAWAYKDAEYRGESGFFVALLVFLATWPIGLIIWLIFRPDNKRRS